MSREGAPESPEEAADELGHHVVGQGERCTDCDELLADHEQRDAPEPGLTRANCARKVSLDSPSVGR